MDRRREREVGRSAGREWEDEGESVGRRRKGRERERKVRGIQGMDRQGRGGREEAREGKIEDSIRGGAMECDAEGATGLAP